MYFNQMHPDINTALPALCRRVLTHGQDIDSRAGATKDLTHVGLTLTAPWNREITLPGRKHNLAAQIAETMWVLSGRDDVAWLERYLPRARDFSDDGEVWRGGYGKRIRRWPRRSDISGGDVIDQLAHVVRLLKADPNTRRAVISVYDPEVDTADGKDIPCNDFLTFSIRNGQLDLGVTIRSNDLMWGWSGINAFEWSALQEIVAGLVGVAVGSLHFSITSLHLYDRHYDRAGDLANQVGRVVFVSPRFYPNSGLDVDGLDDLFNRWFLTEEYIRTGYVHADKEVENFPEPMLRSWLRVLQWWWSADDAYLKPLENTMLEVSARVAMQPKVNIAELEEKKCETMTPAQDFVTFVSDLHAQKHAAYGDSWKRRGEMISIMANIARKIDRLGTGGATDDESTADTAIDLLVYLAKYRWWLRDTVGAPNPSVDGMFVVPDFGDPQNTNRLIKALGAHYEAPGAGVGKIGFKGVALTNGGSTSGHYSGGSVGASVQLLERSLGGAFNRLESAVLAQEDNRYQIVDTMLPEAYVLAYTLWRAEQS